MLFKIKDNVFKLFDIRLKLIILFLLLNTSLCASGQTDLTLAEAKALYTIEIAKQITWPNDASMSSFIVGILGDDEDLMKAFKQSEPVIVREKNVRFELIEQSNFSPALYSIIFVTKRKSSFNSKLFQQTKNSLIITEGRVKKEEQMIGLDVIRDQLKIKLNMDNLTALGFEVSINLLEFAGTKDDLTEILREKEANLKDLLSKVDEKEKSLLLLNANLAEKNKRLETAKTTLKANQKDLDSNRQLLDSLFEEIESSKSKLSKNKMHIETQRQLIVQKQAELSAQEFSVNQLKNRIKINKDILQRQTSKIEKQGFVIQKKQETIITQRGWIIVSILVSIIFFVLIYYLLKASKSRQKANKELEHLNSQLYQLATTDDMTQLFNRRYFLEQSQKELIRQKRNKFQSVMLMMDIDHFKNINDTYGHIAGDEVIRTIAQALKTNMREYDIVGRFGGEEFAMMLLDCDIHLAKEKAQKICDKISRKLIPYKELEIQVTISIGLSELHESDTHVEQILTRADKALYQAKNDGRNQISVFIEMS